MIVVLDTNVSVSALLSSSGSPAKIFNCWEAEQFEVVVTPLLLAELRRTLTYPRITKYLESSGETVDTFLRRYELVALLVVPEFRLEVITEDPADNRVLECAVAGNASYIVTGDKYLLGLAEYQGIVILPPAALLALLNPAG